MPKKENKNAQNRRTVFNCKSTNVKHTWGISSDETNASTINSTHCLEHCKTKSGNNNNEERKDTVMEFHYWLFWISHLKCSWVEWCILIKWNRTIGIMKNANLPSRSWPPVLVVCVCFEYTTVSLGGMFVAWTDTRLRLIGFLRVLREENKIKFVQCFFL